MKGIDGRMKADVGLCEKLGRRDMASDNFSYTPPSTWRPSTLGELCKSGGGDIQTGPFGSQLHAADYVANGIPAIMPTNIAVEGIQTDGIARIIPRDAERLSKYRVSPGDIIYSRRGDVEKCALVSNRESGWLCGTGCLRVRLGNAAVSPAFLHAYLSSPPIRAWVVRHAVGATMPNLNTSILAELPVSVPPHEEMECIGALWSSLLKKTNQLGAQNRTLEAIARAIFKSWFVDFDPVRAKAEGREPEGIDADTAALFPSEFEESVFGLIPRGWTACGLDTIAAFLNGIALQKYPAVEGEEWLPAIKIAQLNRGSVDGADRISLSIPEKYIVRDGDLLFSWSGSLEVDFWTGGTGAINQHLFKVTSAQFQQWFVYLWLRFHLRGFREIAESKVTTMGHIQRHHLSEAIVVVPPPETLSVLGEFVGSLIERVVAGRLQARTLADLRDTLLPRLISGKLRVPEAEKLVEAVL